jgi:hypothetical protein
VRGYEWNTVDLPIAGLPRDLEGLRILHLTDFHLRNRRDDGYDDLVQRIAQKAPDLILFTGDFVDDRYDYRDGLPHIKNLVNQMNARLGFVGILGNHDGDLLGAALGELKITLIDHRRLCLTSGNATLELIGVAGVDRQDLDLPFLRSIGPKAPGAVRIALSHYPDSLRKTQFLDWDLFLCGHTHGGQVCLPGGYPLMRHDSFPRRLCTGIHRAYGTWLVANRGLGYSSRLQLRLFCPAEVIEIRLSRLVENSAGDTK